MTPYSTLTVNSFRSWFQHWLLRFFYIDQPYSSSFYWVFSLVRINYPTPRQFDFSLGLLCYQHSSTTPSHHSDSLKFFHDYNLYQSQSQQQTIVFHKIFVNFGSHFVFLTRIHILIHSHLACTSLHSISLSLSPEKAISTIISHFISRIAHSIRRLLHGITVLSLAFIHT